MAQLSERLVLNAVYLLTHYRSIVLFNFNKNVRKSSFLLFKLLPSNLALLRQTPHSTEQRLVMFSVVNCWTHDKQHQPRVSKNTVAFAV